MMKQNQKADFTGTDCKSAPAGYPNPTRSGFTAKVTVPYEAAIEIHLFDVTGRKQLQIIEGTHATGVYEFAVAEPITPGIYMLQMQATSTAQPVRMVRKQAKVVVLR